MPKQKTIKPAGKKPRKRHTEQDVADDNFGINKDDVFIHLPEDEPVEDIEETDPDVEEIESMIGPKKIKSRSGKKNMSAGAESDVEDDDADEKARELDERFQQWSDDEDFND